MKLEAPLILEYFLSQPGKWKVDLKTKNKDGHAPIHMAVKKKSEIMFNIIASNMM